jgi:hypothetical protein
MNEIQNFYMRKLDAQRFTNHEIAEIISKQQMNEKGIRWPFIIWFTVIVVGSLYIVGATAILTNHLEFLISVGEAVLGFFIAFLLFRCTISFANLE